MATVDVPHDASNANAAVVRIRVLRGLIFMTPPQLRDDPRKSPRVTRRDRPVTEISVICDINTARDLDG